MGPKTKQLIDVLDKLTLLLGQEDEKHWANWMSSVQNLIVAGYFRGIEKLLSAYGGMGSLNDVYLKNTSLANDDFSTFRETAWKLAVEIKHDYESDK